MKSSLEGLSERETRILAPDEFTPAQTKTTQHKNFPMNANIQSGSGLPNTTLGFENPVKSHDGMGGFMAQATGLTTAEQIMRNSKALGAGGDVFMTGKWFFFFNGKDNCMILYFRLDSWTRRKTTSERSTFKIRTTKYAEHLTR